MAFAEQTESGQPGRRILIVDDDPDFAEALQISLTANGYEVEMADSGAKAMSLLAEFAAEIALVDIRLGQTSGINLIDELRRVRESILPVMITAYASAETAIDALHHGACDYLCKPFHSSDLLAIVERCFRHIDLTAEKRVAETALRARNEELERVNLQLGSTVESMRVLAGSQTLRDLCRRLLETVVRNLGAESGALYLIENGSLSLQNTVGSDRSARSIALPPEEGSVLGRALNTRKPVLLRKSPKSPSRLIYPMLGSDDTPFGLLELAATPSTSFTPQDREFGLVLVSFGCETYRVVQALEDLANSEQRFRSIVENSPAAVALKDLEGRFLLVNRRLLERNGLRAEDLIGRTSFDVHPKALAEILDAQDREALEADAAVERELEIPFADGAPHAVLVTKFPVLDADGSAMGVGTISTDITERRRMEEQLRQSQKMEALGQLTGGVAHDFNNLLAIIFGNLDLLHEEIEGRNGNAGLVEDALEAARRGAELTRRLLAFGRRQTLRPESTDIDELVLGMISLLERTLGETIEIETISSGALPTTMVDQGQLEMALLNLAVNARDAMPDGGKLTIETGWADLITVDDGEPRPGDQARPGRHAMLSMHDTGSGMTEAVVAQAFEPFFTTKELGRGSGLGLSMVYGFVKQSGGHVVLDSSPGQGTTVRLYLPASECEPAQRRSEAVAAIEPAGRGETVLVVEDEDSVRRLACELLRRMGYQVTSAGNGSEALEALDGGTRFDLLFTDVVLPGGMSGLQLAAEAQSRAPGLKVLFVSGYATDTLEADNSGDRSPRILNKPFRRESLAKAIREALDAGPANREVGG